MHRNFWSTCLWLVCGITLVATAANAQPTGFDHDWEGNRRWVGPETWAVPLYSWEVKDNRLIADAAPKHRLHLLTWQLENPTGDMEMRTQVEFLDRLAKPGQHRAGFAFGMRGLMDDYRHRLSGTLQEHVAGIDASGRLFIDDRQSPEPLVGGTPVELKLLLNDGRVTLTATRDGESLQLVAELPQASLAGNLGLLAEAPGPVKHDRAPARVAFDRWSVSGTAVEHHPEQTFGPILWTQYTLSNGTLKLNAQFAPVGGQDATTAKLTIGDREWAATIDPMSRTALFRVEDLDPESDHPYTVHYEWGGESHTWSGRVRAEPGGPLTLAAFSCDHGYAFPQTRLVQQVRREDPDLVFFAGDQIYEGYGGLRLQRKPLEVATLDYLRKFYQFGWTWREILRDRPSIIIPDDHDVFQGNLWGQGGRSAPGGNMNAGGYTMPAEWVNMVQRTQVDHLPDPVDAAPADQGITVYFTQFEYGGIPFFVLEDRKFKTGPDGFLPKKRWSLPADELDLEGAELLGTRQERALTAWAAATRNSPARVVLSQTIFCKANTHSGKDLKKNRYDFDSNGWPQTPRDRALSILRNNPATIMVHGDQHFGILLRQGIEQHGDGPLAFMVPGTANGFPRAWWPTGGRETGDFEDAFGNRITVLAVANPQRGSNQLQPRVSDDPETTAFKKGSGHGLITLDPAAATARFDMWRYPIEGDVPFPGFPQTVPLAAQDPAESEVGFEPLFDGRTLDGWHGDEAFWSVRDGVICGGDLQQNVPHNQFLRSDNEYGNFELRLQFKLTGERTNAGVQFRTEEIPDHHEVRGYQADLGEGWWGCLYDESRRRRILAGPEEADRQTPVRIGEWNDYRIRCQGDRIQLWINGQPTVDYVEPDPEIPQRGVIALQVHGNLKMEARYRNIRLRPLSPQP